MSGKKITILGSGIAGLSCASFLAKAGHDVTILEKNATIGGRARQFTTDNGFVFDMGPSWYWMPDVFEQFYQKFGHTTADFYELKRLDPSYQVFWEDGTGDQIPASMEELEAWFERLEPGSALKLRKFLKDAAYKYEVGMQDLVFKPSLSLMEFADRRVMGGLFKMHLLSSFSKYIRAYFKHPKILSLLEFPVLFLGATPEKTPALYSLMNYADIQLGTWYPMGGMFEIINAFEKIALEQGVKIITGEEVNSFAYAGNTVSESITLDHRYASDFVVSGADYRHTETLLNGKANYSDKYWDKRVMAPSSLLYYVGVNKKIDGLQHHNLFFDEPFAPHAHDIYTDPKWPAAPLFYLCCPSKTDPSVAPEGHENLFFLIPLAPDLKDDPEKREEYFQMMLKRLEQRTGVSISENIVYKRSFCIDDFKKDYNAFKGNAYGLANTLKQTAFLKPKLKNKNLSNLFYTGQLTVPGPGVPPSIISGEVVANEVLKAIQQQN
ncbi:MAG: phytoene desaturase family protein [Fluviicola sp.]|nr:phytoene desaturase family protein [Fluviicola sp.]